MPPLPSASATPAPPRNTVMGDAEHPPIAPWLHRPGEARAGPGLPSGPPPAQPREAHPRRSPTLWPTSTPEPAFSLARGSKGRPSTNSRSGVTTDEFHASASSIGPPPLGSFGSPHEKSGSVARGDGSEEHAVAPTSETQIRVRPLRPLLSPPAISWLPPPTRLPQPRSGRKEPRGRDVEARPRGNICRFQGPPRHMSASRGVWRDIGTHGHVAQSAAAKQPPGRPPRANRWRLQLNRDGFAFRIWRKNVSKAQGKGAQSPGAPSIPRGEESMRPVNSTAYVVVCSLALLGPSPLWAGPDGLPCEGLSPHSTQISARASMLSTSSPDVVWERTHGGE